MEEMVRIHVEAPDDLRRSVKARPGMLMPFRLVGDFPMLSTVKLQFGGDLGGGTVTLRAETKMTLAFTPSGIRDTFHIQLEDVHLAFHAFDLPLPSADSLRIDGFEVGIQQFDRAAFDGTLNYRTKEVTLKFVIVLDPSDLPILASVGISEPMRLVADEKGRLDILTGAIDTHAAPFNLGAGPFQSVIVMGGQFSSGSTATGTTTATPATEISISALAGSRVCDWEGINVTIMPNPGAGKPVNFSFAPATGSIDVEFSTSPNPAGGGSSPLTVNTDANGQARAYYHIKAGSQGNSGNMKVVAPDGTSRIKAILCTG